MRAVPGFMSTSSRWGGGGGGGGSSLPIKGEDSFTLTPMCLVVGEDFVEVNIPEFFLKPGGVMCFDITLIDDMEIEGREFFLLALRDLTWGEIVDIATVTINDDDGQFWVLMTTVSWRES